MNATTQHYLCQLAAQLAAAPHGGKGALLGAAAAHLGCSLATLQRKLAAVRLDAPRKTRSDAGQIALPLDEAQAISAYLLDHLRGLGKQSKTLAAAVADLRANGLIRAAKLCAETGELLPLHESTIARALRHYGLHPEQLRRPRAAVQQASLHPNHVWQLDASTCTLFYMDDDGSAAMPEAVFYKNKLENFQKVAKQRVTRFVLTDHTSGYIKVRYYFGGESVANFSEFFIWCMCPSGNKHDPMHGVPKILMVDPGSGMAGAFRVLVQRLGIRMIVNAPGNPRAKGQVENAQNLVEMGFEGQFRAHRPANLAELNDRAHTWAAHFNSQRVHSRHGKTRSDMWQTIAQSELRVPVSAEVLRALLTAPTKECKVNTHTQVQFAGRVWDVSAVPGVLVGEKLHITFNAYNDAEVFAVFKAEDGQEVLHPCPLVATNERGFGANANVIGDGYEALPDSSADTARKRLAQIATGQTTQEAADRALKDKKRELFSGRIRFDHLQADLDAAPIPMPRRGEVAAVGVQMPAAAARTLSHFEAGRWLSDHGVAASAERNAAVKAAYPDGVPEDELEALKTRLTADSTRAQLRVVNG